MGTIQIVDPEHLAFEPTIGQIPEEYQEKLSPEELDSDARTYYRGSETEPQLFEVRFGPNVTAKPHAHDGPEIMLVTQGQMSFGRQICRVGTTVYIPGDTLYSFTTGPDGVTFMNFRTSDDRSHTLKEEFVARRQDDRHAVS